MFDPPFFSFLSSSFFPLFNVVYFPDPFVPNLFLPFCAITQKTAPVEKILFFRCVFLYLSPPRVGAPLLPCLIRSLFFSLPRLPSLLNYVLRTFHFFHTLPNFVRL